MFYNSASSSGWIVSALKVRRLAVKRTKNMTNEEPGEANLTINYTEENAKTDIEFLRTVAVNDANMPIIEEKLMMTLKHRALICQSDNHPNLLERFPYSFTHASLVGRTTTF